MGARRPTPSGELTPAERRTVELAAKGLANKEIAQALLRGGEHGRGAPLARLREAGRALARAARAAPLRPGVARSKIQGLRDFAPARAGRSVAVVAEFVVELYVSRTDVAGVERGAERARLAAEQLTRAGTRVRYLRSIFVPQDETCLVLFEAASADAVRATARRAALPFDRVVEVVAESRGRVP